MVRAYHAIFTAYGFWLPNDPRGSWSDFVRSWELLRFGSATKTNSRRSLAGEAHDANRRRTAKSALRFPPVRFNGLQARSCARGFARAAQRSGYTIYACSVLPEHVHIVVARHRQRIEQIVAQFKGAATKELIREQLHPMREMVSKDSDPPSPCARRCWKVFLDSMTDIRRAIRYVEMNPVKEDKRKQYWSFVTPFT